jgi:type I restriction enzyme S subunit
MTNGRCQKFKTPVPSVDEQREIVRRIESAFAWTDRLAAEATSARKLIDHPRYYPSRTQAGGVI